MAARAIMKKRDRPEDAKALSKELRQLFAYSGVKPAGKPRIIICWSTWFLSTEFVKRHRLKVKDMIEESKDKKHNQDETRLKHTNTENEKDSNNSIPSQIPSDPSKTHSQISSPSASSSCSSISIISSYSNLKHSSSCSIYSSELQTQTHN